MWNDLHDNYTTEEEIHPFDRVHTDFKSFSNQNVGGKQIRINSRYMRYLLQGHVHVHAILDFNHDMDAPGAGAVEVSLHCVDFNQFIEGCVVDQNVFVQREVFRRLGRQFS